MAATHAFPVMVDLLDERYQPSNPDKPAAEGSSGVVVFRVHDQVLDEVLACKVSPASLAPRLKAEYLATRQVRSAHALRPVGLYHCEDGRSCMLSEWIEGPTLSRHIRAKAALSASEARELLVCLLDALAAAQRAEVVHGDLAPRNILLRRQGDPTDVVVIDWDERAEPADEFSRGGGSLAHIDPYRLVHLGRATKEGDMFSAAKVVAHAMHGDSWLMSDPVALREWYAARLELDPSSPAVDVLVESDPALESVLRRMLAHHPKHRLVDPVEAQRVLSAPTKQHRPAIELKGASALRRARALNSALAVLALVAIGGLLTPLVFLLPPRPSPQAAQGVAARAQRLAQHSGATARTLCAQQDMARAGAQSASRVLALTVALHAVGVASHVPQTSTSRAPRTSEPRRTKFPDMQPGVAREGTDMVRPKTSKTPAQRIVEDNCLPSPLPGVGCP